jgi:glycosyltransferase involved in cell wall biosynthesis
MKKISIIIPTFNSEKYLEYTLKSIIKQNYNNFEIIIIDGGSKDKTLEVIKKYEKYIDYFQTGKDKNMYDAINKGIKKINGEIWAVLNSDDFYLNKNLFYFVNKIFEENNKIDGISFNLINVNENNEIIKLKKRLKISYKNLLSFGYCTLMPQPGTFLKKQIIDEIGYFDINYNAASDYDYYLRILKNNYKIVSKNIYSTAFRIHQAQITNANSHEMNQERLAIIEKNKKSYTLNYFRKYYLYLLYFLKNKLNNIFISKKTFKSYINELEAE